MSTQSNALSKIISNVLIFLGVVLVGAYIVYLPMPELFQAGGFENLSIVLYGLASAGSAFVAWGMIMGSMKGDSVTRAQVLTASACGFALLALMRLVTAVFPPEVFQAMIFLPAGEFVAFSIIAVILLKSR